MSKTFSPLRYPGGKTKIYDKVKTLIESNGMGDRTYVEPFAGGFGIGIRLLYENVVKFVVINDIDPHIYHLWYAVLYQTDDLIRLIREAPITMNERKLQKIVYGNSEQNALHDGFATLF